LITALRAKKLRVGVIAVDPSSPFSGGAILGDRIRYSEHSLDEGVFVRSLGSRGSLGGLSAAAYLMLRAFDACGFDIVLIETVGVGQTELDVLHVADQVTVVLVPESGDSVQAMKAASWKSPMYFWSIKRIVPVPMLLSERSRSPCPKGKRVKTEVFPVVAIEGKGLEPWIKFVLENQRCEFHVEFGFHDLRSIAELPRQSRSGDRRSLKAFNL